MVEMKTSNQRKAYFVEPEILGNRLDFNYYSPEALDAISKLENGENKGYYQMRSLESISSHIMDFQAFSIYNQVKFSEKYNDGWVEFLRVQDLEPIHVNTGKVNWTSPKSHKLMPKSIVKPGDLLLSIIGTLGVASIWPDSARECNSNQCIAKITIKPEFDKHYVAILLNSPIIQALINREAKGTIQKGLTLGGTRKLEIPIPELGIQKYIGTKVRLSERCREEANKLRNSIQKIYFQNTKLGMIEKLVGSNIKTSHLLSSEKISDRIDAEFYQPAYLFFDQQIKSQPHLTLSEVIHTPVKGTQPDYANDGVVYAITGTHIDPYKIELASTRKVRYKWAIAHKKAWVEKSEILITVTGPPLGEAVVIHNHHLPLIINSHVAKIKVRPNFPYPYYLVFLLNSLVISTQVYRYCKGIRQKELYSEDILKFIIPKVEFSVAKEINALELQAELLEYYAEELINNAMLNIEKLLSDQFEMSSILSGTHQPLSWDEIEQRLLNDMKDYG